VARGTAAATAAAAGTSTVAATATGIAPAAGQRRGPRRLPPSARQSARQNGYRSHRTRPDFAFSNGDLTVVGKPVTLAIAVDLDNKRIWGRVGKGAWSGTSGNPATKPRRRYH